MVPNDITRMKFVKQARVVLIGCSHVEVEDICCEVRVARFLVGQVGDIFHKERAILHIPIDDHQLQIAHLCPGFVMIIHVIPI